MVVKVIRWVLALLGAVIGYQVAAGLLRMEFISNFLGSLGEGAKSIVIYVVGGLILGLLFYMLSPSIIGFGLKISKKIEYTLAEFSIPELIISTIGLIIGLIIAALLSLPISNFRLLPGVTELIVTLIYILFGYLGITLAGKNTDVILGLFKRSPKEVKPQKPKMTCPKILDTSVIIDGRIFDICKTGFVEGVLIIPGFVLSELQYIADSSDSLKRTKGRRGLDILNRIQKELDIEVMISDKEYPEISEVDSKLLQLAKDIKGKVVTNDYNLNKVAEFHGVGVLNINELSNAVKPVVIPGEEMVVTVIKDGKESNQGVAYLDDGTMIVVENGKRYVGSTIEVVVTSVLQTAAGRMIFAKPKKNGSKTA
ncbi:PIN/TRAM domain-containing protein [Alkalibacter rhizosphaerae]|uniref:PIN/TRAM domain-containing protein n=1 Tax=Alkalibacter rhizosphaerae TaxID=2815577 RepID=A0A974XE46_9FIRM|nr:PIN/TRAM domain-containing protein [Alkalibacter rhizosphaerae]QSX08158.1 PIN/TRAM domain-containing protein [Alkalibacter rhizosphaerae]